MSGLRKLVPSANALLVFDAAARSLNFQTAAQELNVTQPSISHSIKALERHLGMPLFERGNRGVRLTSAGEALHGDVGPALARIETRLLAMTRPGARSVTIASSTAVAAQWLLPLTAAFQREYPDIQVRMITTDRDLEPGEDVDLAILRAPAEVSDLAQHSILHLAEPFRSRMPWASWLAEAGHDGLEVPETLVVNDYQLLVQACIAGEGVALGWSLVVQNLLDQGYLQRPLDAVVRTPNAFFVIGPQHRDLSANEARFMDWVAARKRPAQY